MEKKHNMKKIFVFSNATNKAVIEKAIALENANGGRTGSSVIEQYLLEAFLPPHPEAAHIMQQLYMGDVTIGEAIQQLYNHCSMGVDGRANQTETYPLVQYLYNALNRNGYTEDILGKRGEWEYYRKNVHNLITELERDASKELKEEIAAIKVTITNNSLEDFMQDPNYMNNLFQFIGEEWDTMKDLSVTYRILASITKFIDWTDTPKDILELRDILKSITQKWNI